MEEFSIYIIPNLEPEYGNVYRPLNADVEGGGTKIGVKIIIRGVGAKNYYWFGGLSHFPSIDWTIFCGQRPAIPHPFSKSYTEYQSSTYTGYQSPVESAGGPLEGGRYN